MFATAIFIKPDEKRQRLNELGLNEEVLRGAVLQGHLNRMGLSAQHPKIYLSLNMWGEIVAALRSGLRPLGWVAMEENNFPQTVHEKLNLSIVVQSGTKETGIFPGKDPTCRSKKGWNTEESVKANFQLSLFEIPNVQIKKQGSKKTIQTWILLHYRDVNLQEIRLELSRPLLMEDGKFKKFAERIILNSIPFGDESVEINAPSGPDIEVDIRRKA